MSVAMANKVPGIIQGRSSRSHSDLVYCRLLFGVPWLTYHNMGLSENLRHLAWQAKVGVVSSESGMRLTRLKVLSQLTSEVEPWGDLFEFLLPVSKAPASVLPGAPLAQNLRLYGSRAPPGRLSFPHYSAPRHDVPLDQLCCR